MDNSIFVGRTAQLDELNNHWREAFHKKQGKVIFLVGEAGIGKTSLVEQFSQSVLKKYSGVQYAYAQCDQVAGDISPYAPFVQILNSLTEQAAKKGDNWFVSYMREVGPDVLGMVPVAGSLLTAAAKSVDFVWQRRKKSRANEADRSQFGQQDLFQQFTDTFRNIATNKNPLLLCIDDWHWADTSSTNLLFHLARQLSDVQLLMIATYRPHDAEAREHPILNVKTEMERYSLCASLELDFLSRVEVESYLAQRFPKAQFTPDFIDWLLKTTSGNALFTVEYLNLLLKEGRLTPEGELTGELSDLAPPTNVEAVIRARLGYLDRDAREMLAYGSVEGEQFTTLVLSRLLGIKALSLLRRLRAIEETHHLITSLGQQNIYEQKTTVYRFIHTLIYRTLHNMLETEEHIEISRLLLELFTEIYKSADEKAQSGLLPHLIIHAISSNDYTVVVKRAIEAASLANDNYAHEEVLKYCQIGLNALSKLSDTNQSMIVLQLDLLTLKATTEDTISNWERSLETYQRAEIVARSNRSLQNLSNILSRIGSALRHLNRYDEALKYFQEGASVAEQHNLNSDSAWAYQGIGDIHWRLGNYEEALEWYQKTLTIRHNLKDDASIAFSYNSLANVKRKQGKFEEALDAYWQSAKINKNLDNKHRLAWNYKNIGLIYMEQGRNDEALNLFEEALIIWEDLRFTRGQAAVASGIGDVYKSLGDRKSALSWYQRSERLNQQINYQLGLGWNYNSLGLIYYDYENYVEAQTLFEKALNIWQEAGIRHEIGVSFYNIASTWEVLGNYPQAINHYRQALTIREELGNPKDIAETRQRIAEVESKMNAET
ncbi:MAG: tetratricopeptide repeat protein [Anaerolineae bacterium]|nr:tetratricopeptide repeat protein [Anaerolineae bacterium]